jgi:hypothetical protein
MQQENPKPKTSDKHNISHSEGSLSGLTNLLSLAPHQARRSIETGASAS